MRNQPILKTKMLLLAGSALLTMPLVAMPAHAQEAEEAAPAPAHSGGAGDIVVTARKRAERLFDVPVAVTAMSAADIERYSSNNIMKVAEMTPGLNIGARTAGGGGAGVTIRGVGTDGSNVGIPQSVALSIDGVMVSRGRALWSSYFDTQQVEVMKGPQALFFGKNATAGVIGLTSKGATDELSAELQASYEFRADEAILDGAVSGPLGDGLGARLAFRVRDMDGYMRNDARPFSTAGKAFDAANNPLAAPYDFMPGADPRPGEREYVGRLTLEFDQGGPFTATFKTMYDKYEDDGAVYPMELVYCNPDFLTNITGFFGNNYTAEPFGDCKPNWHTASSDHPREVAETLIYGADEGGRQYSKVDTSISSLTLNYDINDQLSLTHVTGYYYIRSRNLMNNDWTSFGSVGGTEGERYTQFSQELRLASDFDGPLNFMLGGYYERSRTTFDGSVKFDNGPADANGRYTTMDKLAKERSETISFFGQLSYKITPQVEVAGGARYSHDKKTGFVSTTYLFGSETGLYDDARDSSSNLSPEVTVTYRPSRDLTVYAAYKTGYKAGGINLSGLNYLPVLEPKDFSFRKEKANGFEAGVKAQFANGNGTLQVTAYRYKFSGLQVSAWVPELNAYNVRNAAASRSTGVEVEGGYRVSDQLNLRTSIAYNHSRYLQFKDAACYAAQTAAQGCTASGQDLTDRPTLTSPDWVLTGGFDFDQPVGDDYKLSLSGDVFYSSDYYFIQTQSPNAKQKEFARFNAALRFSPVSEKWSIGVIGRNLTNRKVIVSGQDTPLANYTNGEALNGTLARPREVMLQLGIKY